MRRRDTVDVPNERSTGIPEGFFGLSETVLRLLSQGVENFEQVMHLRELGIRSAQGYVFAPPLPGSAFLQLIEAIDPLPALEPVQAARIRFPAPAA